MNLVFICQLGLGQSHKLETENCTSLIVMSSSESKFNKTYILEKEAEDGVWESISRVNSKASDLNFSIQENGTYKVTIQSPIEGRIQTNSTLVDCRDANGDDSTVLVYPNPTKDILYISIEYDEEDIYAYQIYSNIGQLLKSDKINEANSTLTVLDLPAGVYVIQLTKNDFLFKSSKLIINP